MVYKSSILKFPHGFSTRKGGVGTGIFDSLNLGVNRGDDPLTVSKNWEIFFKEAGISGNKAACGDQVHGKKVCIADESFLNTFFGPELEETILKTKSLNQEKCNSSKPGNQAETDFFNHDNWPKADGFVTNIPGVPLVVFTADCTPVLLEDWKNKVIGAIHCGWRSTVQDIMKEAIDEMVFLGAEKQEICVAVGPAICGNCFEVGAEVVEAARELELSFTRGETFENFYKTSMDKDDKFYLDLRKVIKSRFLALGIKEENIDVSDKCTMELPEEFWSHRYTKGIRGSQANVVMIE